MQRTLFYVIYVRVNGEDGVRPIAFVTGKRCSEQIIMNLNTTELFIELGKRSRLDK